MTAVWRVFFGCSVVLLAFLALSVPFVERGTGSYVIAVVSTAMLLVILVSSATFIYLDWDPFEDLLR
ncbi:MULTISPECIES: hypothetical protein [Saliphagus]|uniref:Uncharacterized protein n=1 Tax=Saliphagus infecundisoli TaxID=1849069 RepID=A0ABD5QH81_9EURY|nr:MULTISPECIES: hypothetical protein [Saliphagus]